MYISRIYADQVALAWSLADSVRQPPRNLSEPMSRRRMRRTGPTAPEPPERLTRWMVITKQSLFGSR
jgi:hypothetical protein